MAKTYATLRDKMSPARRAANDAAIAATIKAMPLNELRRARALTQTTLATTMNVAQSEISKLEQRTDCYVSTLRSYIEAMGGELEIVARFSDGDVTIEQFSDERVGAAR